MKTENKMIYLFIAIVFIYLLLRKPVTTTTVVASNDTDSSNARKIGSVDDWPIVSPIIPNPEPEPSAELSIYAHGAVSRNNIEIWVESNEMIGWIDFLIVSEAAFLAGYTYMDVIASDIQARIGANEIYNFQFSSEIEPGDYVAIVRANDNHSLYSYVYFTIQPDEEEESFLAVKPSWLNRLQITRAASTNQTSIWSDPAGLEIRISNKVSTPQPSGKDHANANWDSETWQQGTSEYAGDFSRVYRYNPAVLGTGGIVAGQTYYIDVRRAAFPNSIYRIEYTVPATDLMYINLIPAPAVGDEDASPYLLTKGWEPHIDIQVSGTSGNWILNDVAVEPLQSNYDWVYQVNSDIVRGTSLLSNYEYKSNAPLQIHKMMIRKDLNSLERWMYPDESWNIPDAGGTMSGNNSIAFYSCIFK